MKTFKIKRKVLSIIFIVLILSIPLTSLAHSGRTDSNGGHHDYNNKSGLGSYHYHHGMGPHLHPGGVCPYSGSGDSNSSTDSYTPPSPSISIESCPDTLNVGDSSGIEYSVSNATSSNSSVTSSDPSIVRINNDKTLTAINVGTAQITIESSGVTKTFSVTVKSVPVEEVEIQNKIEKNQLGKDYKFEATVLPENATNKNIAWSSDNTDILEISDSGNVTTKSSGIITVTATGYNKCYRAFLGKWHCSTKSNNHACWNKKIYMFCMWRNEDRSNTTNSHSPKGGDGFLFR